jgi:hypothetical protein
MILLNPIWLFALAALSVPVAIHLWNIRPGKTLKVGSISLIHLSAQKSSRSFKLHDILLLLLRCLLLALLALVLAMPFWQRHISTASVKGWVLVPKEALKDIYQKFKPSIDSLTKAGYEFHYFDKGFSIEKLNEALVDSSNLKSIANASYWGLVQQLDGQIPSALPVYLFTPNIQAHFHGDRPQIALNLHWQTYTPADSAATWLAKAWLINGNDNIQVVQGNSKPGGTDYSYYTVGPGSPRSVDYVYSVNNGRLVVSTKKGDQSIDVDTATWRFAIYADKNGADAGYVKAALTSIALFTKHKAVINQYTDTEKIPAHQGWIFWLSAKPVSAQIAQNCNNLFAYEQGKVKELSTWINDGSQFLSRQKIALFKTITSTQNNGFALWTDGFGNPLLSDQEQQRTHIYHFYSRFDPAWSDLVWNDDFPKMLLKLVIGRPVEPDAKYDRRAMDTKQLLPLISNEAHSTGGKIIERNDLSRYGWLLLVLVFTAERWLAHRKKSKQVLQNG